MMESDDSGQRRLILLGSTGSIGTSALDVIRHLHSSSACRFNIVGLAAGRSMTTLLKQASEFGVDHLAIAESSLDQDVTSEVTVFHGPCAAEELIDTVAQPGDLVLGAMVGAAGIPATLAAIERGCDILLANKETLVAAGELVMPLLRKSGVRLIPIDSEHSAVFQAMLSGRSIDEVKRVVLTASGGPFRTWSAERIDNATVEEALNHPTWDMGRKITIDSASLMNKALEVIEAHWLFGVPAGSVDVIVHPQSIIHSFVEFVDNSIIAQLGPPDMKTPIQYALTFPHRLTGCSKALDWSELRQMDFEPLDHERFGAVKLAYEVLKKGGTAGAIFNAANEAAVEAFCNHSIRFGQITSIVREALETLQVRPTGSLTDVLDADREAREFVLKTVGHHAGSGAKAVVSRSCQ